MNTDRIAKSAVSGVRMVFAGAAGGVAYRVVGTPGDLVLEFSLFFLLIIMVAVMEYSLLALDPDFDSD